MRVHEDTATRVFRVYVHMHAFIYTFMHPFMHTFMHPFMHTYMLHANICARITRSGPRCFCASTSRHRRSVLGMPRQFSQVDVYIHTYELHGYT